MCVQFGDKYSREYVEKLRNMVKRHTTVPYEFVCLTDDPNPIEGVRSIVQPNAKYLKGWWHKVHMFDKHLPISGRIVYFDLDVVIFKNIDKLFDFKQNQIVGIRDFNRAMAASWKKINSSVMAWNAGEEYEIYEKFIADQKFAMRMHGDQDWIYHLTKDKVQYWPDNWILSYKWEMRNQAEIQTHKNKKMFASVKNDNFDISQETCIAVFHGDPKPTEIQDKFVVDNWL